ncbi:hypothetical protein HK098_005781 [Nowakowskiella sp. JEL0407]|nr:hypothetical protein HK098_005781 [Nowakowskiella sp. JEL0407]
MNRGPPRILTRNADGFFQPNPENISSSPFPINRNPNGFFEQPSTPSTPRLNGPRERRDPNKLDNDDYYGKSPTNGSSRVREDRSGDRHRYKDNDGYKRDEDNRREDRRHDRERRKDERDDHSRENRERDRSYERGDDRKEGRRREERKYRDEYGRREDKQEKSSRDDLKNDRMRLEKGQYYPKDKGEGERRNNDHGREDYRNDVNLKRNDSNSSTRRDHPRAKNENNTPNTPTVEDSGSSSRNNHDKRDIPKTVETYPQNPKSHPNDLYRENNSRTNLHRSPSNRENDLGISPSSRRDLSAHRDQSKDENYGDQQNRKPRIENGLQRDGSFRNKEKSPETREPRNRDYENRGPRVELLRKSPSKPELIRNDQMERQGSTRSNRPRDNPPRERNPYREENDRNERSNRPEVLKKSPSHGDLDKPDYFERDPDRQGSSRPRENNNLRERAPHRDERGKDKYDKSAEPQVYERRNERTEKSDSERRNDRTEKPDPERKQNRFEKTMEKFDSEQGKKNDRYDRSHARKFSDRDGNQRRLEPERKGSDGPRRMEPERKGSDPDRRDVQAKRSPPVTVPDKSIVSPTQKFKMYPESPQNDVDIDDMLMDLTSEYEKRRTEIKKKKSAERLNQTNKNAALDPFQVLQGELDAILNMQLQKDNQERRGRRDEPDKQNQAISPRSESLHRENEHPQQRRDRSADRGEYERQRRENKSSERNEFDRRENDRRENDRRRRDVDDNNRNEYERPRRDEDTDRNYRRDPNLPPRQMDGERKGGGERRDRANIMAERERRELERNEREKEDEERRKERERQDMREKERDKERQKDREKELEAFEMKRREAERNKMIAKQREKDLDISPEQLLALMDKLPDVDETVISSEYVNALIVTLRKDTTITPIPEDFSYSDGFIAWQQSITKPFQEVLSLLLKARYLDPNGRGRKGSAVTKKESDTAIKLFFKVVEARGLSITSSKSREPDAFCTIEYGNFDENGKSQDPDKQFYRTETKQGTRNPVWNQHLNFTVVTLTTSIILSVWDDKGKKQTFMGRVRLPTSELINMCAKEGYVSRWYLLQPRDKSDKYVEGDVLFEIAIEDDVKETQRLAAKDPERALRKQLVETHVSFRSIYKTLLRAVLSLDMATLGKAITEATDDLLTVESKAILTVFGRQWAVGEAFRVTALLELLFNKYKSYEVPTMSLLKAYETLRENMKKDPSWLSENERAALTELLNQMYDYYKTQISKYKEFYPKNNPRGALETTLLMLRMIHKNPIYREAHHESPESFRDVLKVLMTEASVNRFQKLQELTAPFDESDTDAVIDGLCRLAELISEELQADLKYFDPPFQRELIISKVTADSYLKHYILCIEQHVELFSSEEIAKQASKGMFDLYKKTKRLHDKFSGLVPGLSGSSGMSIERWFLPFVSMWLSIISEKTLTWVQNAVKADNFEAVNLSDKERDGTSSGLPHSTSITDVFSAIHSELQFIMDLGWPNAVQNASFLQNFAKTINRAIEQYCDAIAIGETKEEIKEATLWTSVANTAANMVRPKDLGPRDIAMESCVKICNLEYATHKLNEISGMMDVAAVTKKQRDHRRTMAPLRKARNNKKTAKQQALSEDESIHGAFKIEVSYAENLKAVNKNGMSNSYTTVRVPEGTVVEAPDEETPVVDGKEAVDGKEPATQPPKPPLALTGVACELLKTRVIYDSVNPQWDETFQAILPPVNKLEVLISSRNMLATDQVIGRADIDIGKGTRLKNRLVDHQTHDVFVELEPQGRVLIRMTLEGEDEDVEFWFRRSKERLGRTRDDFTRALVSRLTPFCRQVVLKAIKSEEPAPKGFFTALTAVPGLSDVTVGGVPIDKEMTHNEVNQCLKPIFEYLDKNLGILCESLSEKMAREVIRQIWEEMLTTLYHVLIPALYGEIERDRRVLVKRQTSVVQRTLRQLRDFFHADGEGFGIPKSKLETRKYQEIDLVIQAYHINIEKIKSDYEASARGAAGREKEYLLRLARLRFDRQEDMAEKDKFDGRMWVHEQLVARRARKEKLSEQ